jgi:hypothetical protein
MPNSKFKVAEGRNRDDPLRTFPRENMKPYLASASWCEHSVCHHAVACFALCRPA